MFCNLDKIKSVYDFLKNEGVQDTFNSNNMSVHSIYERKSDLVDGENEKKLKKLLQSTSKEDIKKANLLIQYLVKQEERSLKQNTEIKRIQCTVQLFNEVLDKLIEENSADYDESLLEELYDECIKHKHIVSKLPHIMKEEVLIRDTIRVNEELCEVIAKYKKIKSNMHVKLSKTVDEAQDPIASSTKNFTEQHLEDLLLGPLDQQNFSELDLISKGNPLDELDQIFLANINSDCLTPVCAAEKSAKDKFLFKINTDEVNMKEPPLSAIDDLKEDLLSNLFTEKCKTFIKEGPKVSLNELKLKQNLNDSMEGEKPNFIDILLNKGNNSVEKYEDGSVVNFASLAKDDHNNFKTHLSDIEINFEDLQPSNQDLIVLVNSKEELEINLKLAANKPRPNTSVIVITSINHSQFPIYNFQFDAFVNEPCKLRLYERTENFLPGKKPFSLPKDYLQQIMLLFNPTKKPIKITYTFKYKHGDIPDPVKKSITSTIT